MPWIFLYYLLTGPDEQKFLEASMAYVSGNPILTDAEFDELKLRLKVHLHNFSLVHFRQRSINEYKSRISEWKSKYHDIEGWPSA